MSTRKFVLNAALAIGLAIPAPSQALSQHSQHQVSEALQSIGLNQGQKWPTDQALRDGMSKIRASMADALPIIHQGQFKQANYAALADMVQARIDQVVANCKLPEEADLQLHIALTHMLDGVAIMKSGHGQERGALAVVEALTAYGNHFDHPEWVTLAD